MTDNYVLVGACVGAVGLLCLWFANVILTTRDAVREIHFTLLDKRTGLVQQVDAHGRRLDVIEDNLGLRRA